MWSFVVSSVKCHIQVRFEQVMPQHDEELKEVQTGKNMLSRNLVINEMNMIRGIN